MAGVLTVLMLMSSVNAAAYAAPADTADTSAVVEQPLQTAAMPEATPEATAAVPTPLPTEEPSETPEPKPTQTPDAAPEPEPTPAPADAPAEEPSLEPAPEQSPAPTAAPTPAPEVYPQGEVYNFALSVGPANSADAFAAVWPVTLGLYGIEHGEAPVRLAEKLVTAEELTYAEDAGCFGMYYGSFELGGLAKYAALLVAADAAGASALSYAIDPANGQYIARAGGCIIGFDRDEAPQLVYIVPEAEIPVQPLAERLEYNYTLSLGLTVDGKAIDPALDFTIVSDPNNAKNLDVSASGKTNDGYTINIISCESANKHSAALSFTVTPADGKPIGYRLELDLATGAYTITQTAQPDSYVLSPAAPVSGTAAVNTGSVNTIAPDTQFEASALARLDIAVRWQDNNDTKKLRPQPSGIGMGIQKWTEDGWQDVPTDSYTLSWDTANDSTWHCIVTGLPKMENGQPVSYRAAETLPDSYSVHTDDQYGHAYFEDGEAQITNCVLTELTVHKLWNDGALGGKHPSPEAWLETLTLYINGNPHKFTDTRENPYPYTVTHDGNRWTVKLSGLMAYDDANSPIEYAIGEEPGAFSDFPGTAGTYVQSLKNEDNHSNKTDAAYNNGTLISTLTDTVAFRAVKRWEDAGLDPANRPDVSFTLLTYVKLDDNTLRAATPSPVYGALPINIIGNDRLTDEFELYIASLPKYDNEGYEYAYFLTEHMSGSNAARYVERVENGESIETLKTLITNGSVVINSSTESFVPSITKSWNAKSALGIGGISASFQFQRLLPGADEWENVGEEFTLDGFSREVPAITRSLGAAYPKTDANGDEIKYRFVETGLTVGGAGADEFSIDGSKAFVVQHGENQYIFVVDESRAVISPSTATMGTVINTLYNMTAFKIVKEWQDVQEGDDLWIAVQLYRDGVPYELTDANLFDENGVQVEDAYIEDGMVVFKYKDASDTARFIHGLELYDEEGRRYSYTAFERACTDGFILVDSVYSRVPHIIGDFEQMISCVKFTNVKGDEGRSLRFEVVKLWQDEADIPNRRPVTVGIYYFDPSGAPPQLVSSSIVLSEDNCWTASVRYILPEDAGDAEFNQNNYSVVEISNADGGWTLPMDDLEYLRTGNTKPGAPAQLDVGSKIYAFNVVTNKVNSFDGFAPEENDMHSSVTTITNTRTGWVEAGLTKEWKMGSDAVDARLRLVTYTSDGQQQPVVGAVSTDEAVTTDEKGEFTLSPASKDAPDSVTVTFRLPKYNSVGELISYGIEELAIIGADGQPKEFENNIVTLGEMKYVVSSSVVKYNYCKNEAAEADEMHTRITNSFGGRGTLVVNKVWHDVKAAVAKRPDITLELWRISEGDPQPQNVSGGYKWDLTINDWFWQCTFGKQNFDRFDENGFEYQYYVVEKLVTQNSGYVASYYNGGKQPNALKNPASAQEVFDEIGVTDGAAYAAFVPASASGGALGAAYSCGQGTVINTPQLERSYTGEKIWSHLPEGYDRTQLPPVTVMLFCKSEGEENTYDAAHIARYTNGAPVAPIVLENGETVFAWGRGDEALKLPRFDAYGGRLSYYAAEVVSAEDCTTPLAGMQAYNVYNPEDANLTEITNEYTGGGEVVIEVTKNWSWPNKPAYMTEYPAVTFVLYRAAEKEDGQYSPEDWTPVDRKTLPAGTIPADGSELTEKLTFESTDSVSLSRYAPDNRKYVYMVIEEPVNGYESMIPDGEGGYIPGSMAHVALTPVPDSAPLKEMGSVSFKNVYEERTAHIRFVKTWKDQDNRFSTRPQPDELEFELWYEHGGDNIMVEPSAYEMSWEYYGSVWSCTFTGDFIMNDTDGTPYKYYVKEHYTGDNAALYERVYGLNKCRPGESGVTNTLASVPLSVNKEWEDKNREKFTQRAELEDLKALGKLPDSVTFGVEYLDGAEWKPFPSAEAQMTQTWTIDQLISAVADNHYLRFSEQLPMYMDASGREYTYRAVETALVFRGKSYDAQRSEDGRYVFPAANIAASVKPDGSVTHITNTLGGYKHRLHIYKLWNDANDTDGLRPAEMNVTVSEVNNGAPGNTAGLTMTRGTTNDFNFWYASITVLDDAEGRSYIVTEDVPFGYREEFDAADWPCGITDWRNTIYALTDVVPESGWPAIPVPADGDHSYTLMNRHEPYTISVTADKSWFGDTGSGSEWADYTRPDSVVLQLWQRAGGGSWAKHDAAAVIGDENAWSYTWRGLPVNRPKARASDAVTAYSYKVEEVNGGKAYKLTNSAEQKAKPDSDQHHTVTNKLDVKQVSFTKSWVDFSDAFATRLALSQVKFTLLWTTPAGELEAVPVAVTPKIKINGSEWKISYTGLPKYFADGTRCDYKLREEYQNAENIYTPSGNGVSGLLNTLTNTLVTGVEVEAQKQWAGDEIWQDITRPDSAEFELWYRKGTSGEFVPAGAGYSNRVVTANASGGWTVRFYSLPEKDADGTPYDYDVRERPMTGYDVSYTGREVTERGGTKVFSFTAVNMLKTVSLSGTKTWADNDNYYGMRPDEVSLRIFADEVEITGRVSVAWDKSGGNVWTYTVSGLPKYDKTGSEISYTVMEVVPNGYASTAGDSAVPLTQGVVNTLAPTEFTVSKVWNDLDDHFAARPESVSFTLEWSTDGVNWSAVVPAAEAVLTAQSGWRSHTFTDLPTHDKTGARYSYRAVEKAVPGYEAPKYEFTPGGLGESVTNTLDTGRSVTFTKHWQGDYDNMFASRPDSIEFVLEYRLEGETEFRPAGDSWVTVLAPDASGKWPMGRFTGLPVCTSSGERFVYRVVEKPVTGYAPAYSPAFGDDMTVTNTLSALTSLVVEKTWDDNGDAFLTRPASLTFRLQYQLIAAGQQLQPDKWLDSDLYAEMKPDASGNWPAVSFTDLPAVNASGESYAYRAVEVDPKTHEQDPVKSYDASYTVTMPADGGEQRTSVVNTLKTTSLKVEKSWVNGAPAVLDGYTVTVKLQRLVKGGLLQKDTWADVTDRNGDTLTRTLSKANGWSALFAGLPLCDADGVEYVYRALELADEPWFKAEEPTVENGVCTLTNTIVHWLMIDNITDNPVTHETDVGGFVQVETDGWSRDKSAWKKDGLSVTWYNEPYWQHTGDIIVQYLRHGEQEWHTLRCTMADVSPLTEVFPGAKLDCVTEGERVQYTLTLANDAMDMPYETAVKVAFRPTLAVENTTPDDKFGTVAIEKADRAYDGRYPALSVKGRADSGYAVDLSHLQLSLPGGVHQCWQLNLSAVGIGTGYYGGRFSTTIRGELAGKIETIPVSGTVTIDRRDGYGNPVEVTITLDSLPLSLDIGIPFVKSDAPIYPRTGDNGMDVGTLLAMCGLSLALGGASLGTLCLARRKRRAS